MRYPTVLFDLDGTVIDSGSIILASMRHATREVLGREYEDGELLAAVGGPGLEAQMHVFDPERVAELVRVYREHNEPLHEELVCCAGMDDALVRLKEEGRRLGVVTAKRRVTVDLAFAQVPLRHLFDAIVGGDETVARAWIKNQNLALEARPLEKIMTIAGLVDVIAYLDSRRALV